MVAVKGGTFTMGATSEQGSDAESDEEPTHSVTLDDYYIGKFEVTQELWEAVMGTTVSQQRDKADRNWPLRGKGGDYPMYYVSWEECQEFVSKLNRLTGANFRLPTEAEWEYAARGGNKSKGYKYSGSNSIGDVAWYDDNSGSKTHPVGTKSPNELGIYDMSGNVYEWCQDWYDSYGSGSQTNPQWPSSGSYRVHRGGGWGNLARRCRVSDRDCSTPDDRRSNLGFRLAVSQ
ncbi:MAG: SUMF1/EgtB/PvdO family nonheme iron enzyme [Bacteroidia bacterium]|nr:SUMF1/EgtB/PvdO family nonheme iron enzyme [Bacteroidia bacterium]